MIFGVFPQGGSKLRKFFVVHRRMIYDELGELVGVSGAFGSVGHALNMGVGAIRRKRKLRAGEPSNFKVTHYPVSDANAAICRVWRAEITALLSTLQLALPHPRQQGQLGRQRPVADIS